MKTAIYVLSVLILVLGGVAAALWLTPAPGVGWHETRYGLHEGRELVRQTDRQGRTRYVVEDSLGRKLFHVPVRNCLLDVRFRDGQLHFRENATGRTGYIDPDGIVTIPTASLPVNHEKFTRESTEIQTSADTPESRLRTKSQPRKRDSAPHKLDDEALRRIKAGHPFFREAAKVLSGKLDVDDSERRRVILDYCEHFRTAYTTKDIDFLRQVFSEQALIIVGNMIKAAPDNHDGVVAGKRVEYYLRTKGEYLSRLSRAFAANREIDVKFSDFRILRHPTLDGIYGVRLRQRYTSDRYSDDGWLFLLWDFRDESMPLIHVRTWQPATDVHDTDDVISIGDFNLK